MCVVYECLYTNELIKWRSGQLIVLYTVIGFLICFLYLCGHVCVLAHLCSGVYGCACRPGNEAMWMDTLVWVVCVVVYIMY